MLLWARIEPHFTHIGGIEMVYIAMSPSERVVVQALYVVAAKTTPNIVHVAKAKRPPCRKLDYKQAVELVSEWPRVPVQKQGIQKVEILPKKNHVRCITSKKRVRKIPTAPVMEQIQRLKKVEGFSKNINVSRATTKKRVKQIPAPPVITINSTSASNAKMEKPNEGESVGDNNLELKLNEIFVTLRELRDCCQFNSGLLKELKKNSENPDVHAPHYSGPDPLKMTKGEPKTFYPMNWKAPKFSKHVVGYDS